MKTVHKAIMKQSELASKYYKTKNTKDYNNQMIQRIFFSKKKTKAIIK